MKLQAALFALCLSGTSAFLPKAFDSTPNALYASDMGRSSFSDVNTAGRSSFRPSSPGGTPTPAGFPRRGNIWDEDSAETVQGRSLRTWSFMSPAIERIQVLLKTEGRPLNADVELWQGPDNTPQKMAVYLEDGDVRPFACVIESPRGSNTISIRNTANMEFPLLANVEPDVAGGQTPPLAAATMELARKRGKVVQGGAIVTYPFDPSVAKVSVMMRTDGRPLNARIELLQGPNNNKQVVDVYTEDGMERPFQLILDTPGTGNVVRIINTATIEFPMTASVEPFLVEEYNFDGTPGSSMQSMNSGTNNFFFAQP